MRILGIETSCDETAAAIVDDARHILANQLLSQTQSHAPYGGVVPEIAARVHMEHLERLIGQALDEADMSLKELDAIAVTGGPGLIGGVIVGVMMAKALASVHEKPLIAVNHLEGHALTVRLTENTPFPYLLLLASGGHCQYLIVHGVGKYTRLGGTMDDALGEAYDKTAKLLGLGYPGGPAVEQQALQGDADAYDFPTPLKGREGCDFSFSGLKTAVRQQAESLQPLSAQHVRDLCASFQRAAADSVCDRTQHAIAAFREIYPSGGHFVLAGGVAANQYLRGRLEAITTQHDLPFVAPPITLCTDNAAMIAWAGLERFKAGMVDQLTFEPRARWPLAA